MVSPLRAVPYDSRKDARDFARQEGFELRLLGKPRDLATDRYQLVDQATGEIQHTGTDLAQKPFFTLQQALDWLRTRRAEQERALVYGADAPPHRGPSPSPHKDADRRRARRAHPRRRDQP